MEGERGVVVNDRERLSHRQYKFLHTVLSRIAADFGNRRLRTLSATIAVVAEVASVLTEIGFAMDESGKNLLLRVPTEMSQIEAQTTKLDEEVKWSLEMCDNTLTEETISFAQVAEILQRDGRLPGIRSDIEDSPLNSAIDLTNETPRPKKPWE